MAGTKEIRTKIASVKNTQKITKAMEMVAASKMRKAQDRMRAARPYAEKIRNVISHLAQAHPEYRNAYLEERDNVRRIGLIIISTDRGLCGGLNSNLFRETIKHMKEWDGKGLEMDMVIIGAKAVGFFNRIGGNVLGQATHLGDEPAMEDLIGAIKIMLDAYREEKIDRLYLVSNKFINSMTQTPTIERILPTPPSRDDRLKAYWDYIYEPDAKEVLDHLMKNYIESLVYSSVVENISCEQAARMVAMKSASDNAGKLIDELQLIYNKARQASITQELSEIVGGAAAV
ncbi:MAG: F0F1 ATP synthase subunit gamma [Gammaproteobacteria bacterium]|nr:F0F1 ATP synthase subunit gamma [Gammaproteobacteria bacterium]NIO61622.1 F0F1 ATP synthase subunit gamma [Gammaproteobacteria bacterium]NIQ12767.1 F0F1 ATP synthase subunit gamma [Gammaproteobacteria bacterium]NIQ18873.1 F0F1 ATP synthase subunit gamma [Gammaproteobacteria bacterium]NIQ76017.1 F0F1 ATP synthase subunit gamma [Gammaproteobacteria bacterium]